MIPWWSLLALSTLSFAFPSATLPCAVEGRSGDAYRPTRYRHHSIARHTAQNVLKKYSWWSRGRFSTPTLLASNDQQPWRSDARTYRPTGVPMLRWNEVKNDPRARPYSVDLYRRRPNSYSVTTKIIALTVASYALQAIMPRWTQFGIKLSAPIQRGEQLYRLFTPILLHGGIFHLYVNMQSLARTGGDFERLYGPGRYLATYIAAGVAGNVASAFRSPNPSLGASGAVFGIYGACFTYLTRNEWFMGAQGQAMTNSLASTLVLNLFYGMTNPQIDQWAHVVGAAAGAVMAYAIGPNLHMAQNPANGQYDIIDRPLWRAPRAIEVLPERIIKGVGIVRRRVFGWIPSIRVGKQPWQRPGIRHHRHAPNRSLKPKNVDDVDW